MKYHFIHDHREQISVRRLCGLLRLSRSAYYRWQNVRPAEHQDDLLGRIVQIHLDNKRVYGSPRICRALRQEGCRCNHKRIARLMRVHGIRAKMVRRFKITTRSKSTKTIALDLVNRNFNAPTANRVWTSDITYIWTREGWAYLAIVMDLYSRMIVGWEAGPRLTASLVSSAVKRALYRRRPTGDVVLHSDRGSQYASDDLRSLAKEQNLLLSMGNTGSCYDNAVTESFFHTLKTEHIYFHKYDTRDDARTSIFEYIETFYNQRRLHSALGYLSPVQFENQLT
jgi:putative transposase